MKAIVVAAGILALCPLAGAAQGGAAAPPPGTAAAGTPAPPPKKKAKPAPRAPAEDAATVLARARFQRGAQAYREARYADAIAEFQAAYRLKPSGVLHYNVGQAQEKLGQTAAALASYEAYLREVPDAPNRETVQKAIANLRARQGTPPGGAAPPSAAAGTAAGAGPAVPSPAAGGPGAAPAAGAPPPAAAPRAPPSLAASPPAVPPEATRPVPAPKPVEGKSWFAPIALTGVAVVAAGTGAVFGAQSRNAQDELLGSVHDKATANALASKARNSATTANVLYGVAGAAALAGGAVLVFGGYF